MARISDKPTSATISTAGRNPSVSANQPASNWPSGPVPIQTVISPSSRERIAGGAPFRTSMVCMLLNAAVPVPPTSRIRHATVKLGISGMITSVAANSAEPPIISTRGGRRGIPRASSSPASSAPADSAAASSPTSAFETWNRVSAIGATRAE